MAAAQPAQKMPLSQRFRKATRGAHAASDKLVRSKAPVAFAYKRVWAELLSQFYWVFRAIEENIEIYKAHEHIAPLAPLLRRCRRVDAILADVAFFTGRPPAPPTPETAAYVASMAAACKRSPTLLLAHAYTMYMALLAGGQILRVMLITAMGLGADGRGCSIFTIEQLQGKAEQRRFKEQLRGAVDRAGGGLNEPQILDLIREKQAVFRNNDAVIAAVMAAAPERAAGAWLRIALRTVAAPPRLAAAALRGAGRAQKVGLALLALAMLMLAVLLRRRNGVHAY